MLEGQKIGTYSSQREHDFRLIRDGDEIECHERHQCRLVGMERKRKCRLSNEWKGMRPTLRDG
jgi:hypothetical protein